MYGHQGPCVSISCYNLKKNKPCMKACESVKVVLKESPTHIIVIRYMMFIFVIVLLKSACDLDMIVTVQ